MDNFTPKEVESISARAKAQGEAMESALGVVSDNSLADRSTVDAMVRDFALRRLRAFDPGDRKASLQADMDDCMNMGAILTGQDPAYTSSEWNSKLLAPFVAKELGWTGENDQETVAQAFLQFLIQIYTIYNQACDGTPDESWQWQINAAVEDMVNLLTGVKPPTATEASIAAQQDE